MYDTAVVPQHLNLTRSILVLGNIDEHILVVMVSPHRRGAIVPHDHIVLLLTGPPQQRPLIQEERDPGFLQTKECLPHSRELSSMFVPDDPYVQAIMVSGKDPVHNQVEIQRHHP